MPHAVSLQNRSAVAANFGLIDMSKLFENENGFQNVPVLACERTQIQSVHAKNGTTIQIWQKQHSW